MSDTSICTPPDLSLVMGPEDSVAFVTEDGGTREGGLLYVAVHRRHGLWTHVYRVVPEDGPDHLLVHLEKVFDGDRVTEARHWALSRVAMAAE